MAFDGSDSLHENELCLEDDISRGKDSDIFGFILSNSVSSDNICH
jgi:hypothetical protein